MYTYTITCDGKKNIEIAEKIANGHCYGHIANGMAQVEVVIPYGEQGYTCPSKKHGLIDISYINQKNVDAVLAAMKQAGFSGLCLLCKEDSFGNQKSICAISL